MNKLLLFLSLFLISVSVQTAVVSAEEMGCVGAGCAIEEVEEDTDPCANPDPDKVWPWGLNPCNDPGTKALEKKRAEREKAEREMNNGDHKKAE